MNVKVKANRLEDESHMQLALKAHQATCRAYKRALSSSLGVLRIEDGQLVRVMGDGTKRLVGKAEPRRKVKLGQVLIVRRADDKDSRSKRA